MSQYTGQTQEPPTPEEFDKITLAHEMKNVDPPLTYKANGRHLIADHLFFSAEL